MKNDFRRHSWCDVHSIPSKNLICWNCGENISANRGYYSKAPGGAQSAMKVYICHVCNAPNIIDISGKQVMKSLPGKEILRLPGDIETVYNEARACMSVNAYTAAVAGSII